MDNNKQSSVEWFAEQTLNAYITKEKYDELFEQAKAMHKEEIMKAFNKGHNMDQNNIWADAEWYYIVIFGGNNV